ncbi:helix-hairpin-helix domain-containing protein [Nocardia sp. NPDC050406]|uniref:helix-hairpin-helix domain-containing protein n=1 Tax=Nocardia sp. NPDC050406 TaxID=3364318 RepID=UPI0037BDDD49
MTESTLPRAIGQVAARALGNAGYDSLDQLAGVPEKDLLTLHGVGPKAIRVLRESLRERGLDLG